MAQRINHLFPKANDDEKQQILGVTLRAMDNMLRVEGGSFEMSDFGMKCRVAEWANDWYAKDYYKVSPVKKTTGSSHVQYKVMRRYADLRTFTREANVPFLFSEG